MARGYRVRVRVPGRCGTAARDMTCTVGSKGNCRAAGKVLFKSPVCAVSVRLGGS